MVGAVARVRTVAGVRVVAFVVRHRHRGAVVRRVVVRGVVVGHVVVGRVHGRAVLGAGGRRRVRDSAVVVMVVVRVGHVCSSSKGQFRYTP
ncbi:hypothetical protein GCM10025773_26490 [Microbacterium jejuense]